MTVATRDILWLAGLIEGEGSFRGAKNGHVGITLGMTDEDIIDRIARIMRGSKATVERKQGYKAIFRFEIYGPKAAGWMMTLYTLMGNRRQAKIRECLKAWKTIRPKRNRDSRWCLKGHELTEENVYSDKSGRRSCIKCRRFADARWRKAHRKEVPRRETTTAEALLAGASP